MADGVEKLRKKLRGYRERRDALRQEQARQEERLKAARESREEAAKRLKELTGSADSDAAKRDAAAVYARLEKAAADLDAKLDAIGVK